MGGWRREEVTGRKHGTKAWESTPRKRRQNGRPGAGERQDQANREGNRDWYKRKDKEPL